MKSSPRAFTFVELLIAILIVAILSIALLTNFQRSRLKANFDDQVTEVVDILQKARSYSRTNMMVLDTEPADYYLLTISSSGITIDAYGPTVDEGIESMSLDSGFEIDNTSGVDHVFYFPPSGEICMDTPDCASGITEITFTVQDDDGTYTKDITINVYGGYPELD